MRTDFDGCMRVLNDIVSRKPIYLLNSINPFRLEGQKTVAFELMEQFDWNRPTTLLFQVEIWEIRLRWAKRFGRCMNSASSSAYQRFR